MKFRVALQLPEGGTQDVTLACDVTATVADLARTLIRAGLAADPMLSRIAGERLRPVTLQGSDTVGGTPVLLDPGAPVVTSGLQSGWTIEPVAEFGGGLDPASVRGVGVNGAGAGAGAGAARGGAGWPVARLVTPASYLEVLTGEQAGALYSLLPGPNVIGRDAGARVYLGDRSVSRRHAVIDIDIESTIDNGSADCRVWLRDLGSANGTYALGPAAEESPSTHGIRLRGATELQLGDVTLRYSPGPIVPPAHVFTHRTMHTRSPRVEEPFQHTTRDLAAPPAAATPTRIPWIALVAPMLMGGVLFAVTRSPMSLMMMAFSPAMMIGSWLDGKRKSRRTKLGEQHQFQRALAAERRELAALLAAEIEVRGAEAPSLPEIAGAIVERSGLLWARRPEHRSFLEVRFGEGALPSRTSLTLPDRGDSDPDAWQALRRLAADFAVAAGVPVLERLDQCGAIGLAGESLFVAGMARALVLQLAGLHSPEELVLACFAGSAEAAQWEWLKWLPHTAAATSPIAAWQLADDAASTARLLIALEALIEVRRGRSAGELPFFTPNAPGRSNGAGAGPGAGPGAGSGSRSGAGSSARACGPLPAVVVLVLADDGRDAAIHARLIALAEVGPDVAVHVIWVTRTQQQLPAACRTFAVLGAGAGQVGFVLQQMRVPLTRLEYVDAPMAVQLARALAPIEDAAARTLDESDLPKAVALREIHPVDLAAGAAAIRNAWRSTLVANWVPGADRPAVSLAAPVGQSTDGPCVIDLRLHGPHALVGGTTGAGKSEFLQSWIMSLAASVSPDRLTFLLVDYKGGAAFAECVELPHTVGLVTDLTPHLVRRALTSLRAELRFREELLAAHGAKDLMTMERRSDPAAPPVLVVVVDEFAALASEMPEFVDGVVDVAQRGRSLGLHVILATQRPAGVIKDNLRANTNLRVALRMADEADSSDVIGVKDAAFFAAETPGRGAIKVGPGRIAHFQAGYVGGRSGRGDSGGAGGNAVTSESAIELRTLGFAEGEPWVVPGPAGPVPSTHARAVGHPHEKPPRDIERLRDNIVAAAREERLSPPRKPWLEELPERLALHALSTGGRPEHDAIIVGLSDVPDQQAQLPVVVDLEQAGNLTITGVSGSGKTSALITLAAALSMQATAHPVELYVIDAAGGALDALRVLPTVSAVAPLVDTELTGRVLRRVLAAVGERASRFAAARCSGLTAYRGSADGSSSAANEPRIVLLVDGYAAFRQAAEAPGGPIAQLQQLSEIMSTGRAAGVHVVLTSDRPGAISAALVASVQAQFVLRLANPADYSYLGVAADALDAAPPGRAMRVGGHDSRPGGGRAGSTGSRGVSGYSRGSTAEELQFALVGGEPELQAQARAIEALATQLLAAGVTPVPQVRKAPARVSARELPAEVAGRPVYGIDTADFAPVTLPAQGLAVLAGPSGSGLSTAALRCAAAVTCWASAQGMPTERILLTLTSDGLRHRGPWDRVAYGETAVAELARELTTALGATPPRAPAVAPSLIGSNVIGVAVAAGGEVGARATARLPAAAGQLGSAADGGDPDHAVQPSVQQQHAAARRVIVIERAAAAEGTAALAELVALVKVARRADALVLVEFEMGAGGAMWDLFTALKQPTWGLTLQPDESESQSPFREQLGRVKRANFPPGRGFAIERGRVTPIHVAVE